MMLLRSLNDLYSRLVTEDRLPPVGYQRRRIRFLVDLDTDGQCLSIVDTAPDETVRTVPEVSHSSDVLAYPACGNGQYVLGLAKRNDDKAKILALNCHAAFLERLDEAAEALEARDQSTAKCFLAIAKFVRDRDQAIAQFENRGISCEFSGRGELPQASAWVVFRVDGIDATESPAVQNWWAEIVNARFGSDVEGVCQVSGIRAQLARKMPGVRGTSQLISANFAAGLRYSATQSSAAQISVPVAIRTHQALDWLLTDKHHRRRIGDLTFLWWLDGDLDYDLFNLIAQPHPDDVAALLDSPRTGRRGPPASADFRLLGLSSNEGRRVIRVDHVSKLADVERSTMRWFELIARPGRDGSTWWPAIWHLAEAAVPPGEGNARKARKDRVVEVLARAAIAGTPLPRSLLAALVDRCRTVPIPRSSGNVHCTAVESRLACLNLYMNLKEDRMGQTHTSAVLCGRMLAELEAAQHAALGYDINRTIVDRYYASASTTPKKVFAGLFKTANHHLAKAGRSDRGKGAQIAISRRLEELFALLIEAGGWPITLSLDEQADFALGYWDERQARFRRAQADTDETAAEEE